MKRTWVPTFLALSVAGLYFTVSAADGLSAFFSMDDASNILNLHKCLGSSVGSVLKSLVDGSYRPLGGVF